MNQQNQSSNGTPDQARPRIGIALAGGGARGFVHLGHLAALEAFDMRPDVISGASAGAIVGAFYGSGFDPKETRKIISSQNYLRLFRPAISRTGLLSIESAKSLFLKYLKPTFEGLSTKLIVNATDLEYGKTAYFDSGELFRPLAASSAIPIVFDPVEIDGRVYVDGGVLNNMPTEPLLGKCDLIFGSHCNTVSGEKRIRHFANVMERSFHLAIERNVQPNKSHCDLLFEPPEMDKYFAFEVSKSEELFELGYRHASEKLEAFLKSGDSGRIRAADRSLGEGAAD